MATAQKLTDHFLTCTICHEVFTDPSTLACGHSFCGQCIVSFTKTKADAIRSKSIPCPFCRRLTRVPDPSRPVEEWAGQMRPSLLLKGLLDTVGPGAKDTTNCNWCHEEGETTQAVSWCSVCDVSLCSNCLKAHRRSPSTRHHDVSDMTEEVKVKRRTKVTCHEHKEEFVKALNSESEMDMHDLYQSSESEAAESVGDVKKRGTRTMIEFSQDMDRLDRVLSELSLGEIQVFDEEDLDSVSKPVLSHTVDCRTKGDQDNRNIPHIVSMDVKGSVTLIVTDYKNNCIKSFFKRNNQQHYSRLKMQSKPGRIAKLEDNKIAVILPNSKQIAVVSVTPDLTLDSTITTQKKYVGLTALTPTTLAAGSDSPPCVDILDRSGNVMRSIDPIYIGRKIIQTPYYICTTRQRNILISDDETKSVVCVTPQGEVVFNYSPTGDRELIYPMGITSTAAGHILVVEYHGHKVIQLSESGEFVRDILTSQEGTYGPLATDWDERERIYVTHWIEDGDSVQVYTLK